MSLDDIIITAATTRANELIKQIESGELTYETVMDDLRGGAI